MGGIRKEIFDEYDDLKKVSVEFVDEDTLIQMSTFEFLASIPSPCPYSDSELKVLATNYISGQINTHNLLHKDNRIRKMKSLVNASIAMIMTLNHDMRCVKSGPGETIGVGIFMTEGVKTGTYSTDDEDLRAIISRYKFQLDDRDVKDITATLVNILEPITVCADKELIPFGNCIFNYKTKTVIGYSPDKCFLTKSQVDYIEAPLQSPKIPQDDGTYWTVDDWLESLSDDPEIVDLLWKIIGAVLRPNVNWNVIPCLYAETGLNGKGTYCELLRNLVGENNCASIPLSEFNKSAYVCELVKKTAVINDENDTNDFVASAGNLKKAATQDPITADVKFKPSITFRFRGLIVQCINSLPRINDQTDSLYRRLRIIPFTPNFRGMENKAIKAEYLRNPDVLRYVAQKVMNLPYYDELSEPESCRKLLGVYKEYNDPVRQFVNEVFPSLVWNKVPQSFIYDLYGSWCSKNNPSGKIIGKLNVINRIKQILEDEYGDIWAFCSSKVAINKTDNLQPELMIQEYGLEDWKSTYSGVDPNKICKPDFKQSYNNVFVRVQSVTPIIEAKEVV